MSLLRWLIILLILWTVAFIALRLWVRHVSTPSTEQPLFHEWRERDQGWKWATDGPVVDRVGNWMYCDKALNFLVIIATLDSHFSGSLNHYRHTSATIHAQSPYETTVVAAQDSLLIVIPGRAVRSFHINHGFAVSIYAKLWNAPPDDCVSEVLAHYRGSDAGRLAEFLDANRVGGNVVPAISTQPSVPVSPDSP